MDKISPEVDKRWWAPGARGIGTASLLADVGSSPSLFTADGMIQ